MNIRTKFDVGDDVWFAWHIDELDEKVALSRKVVMIRIEVSEIGTVTVVYSLAGPKTFQLPESTAYSTRNLADTEVEDSKPKRNKP